jgi:hypothetical protein
MQNLVGRKVRELFVSDAQSVLVFKLDDGEAIYDCIGDCCSETWVADIVGVDRLLGQTVLKAEWMAVEAVEDGRSRQESDDFYGIKLTTTRGYVDIVYRNSSNGYYGGWMERSEEAVYRGKLIEITEDYSA